MYAAIAITGTAMIAIAIFVLTSIAFGLGGPLFAVLAFLINLFFGIWTIDALWNWCSGNDRP